MFISRTALPQPAAGISAPKRRRRSALPSAHQHARHRHRRRREHRRQQRRARRPGTKTSPPARPAISAARCCRRRPRTGSGRCCAWWRATARSRAARPSGRPTSAPRRRSRSPRRCRCRSRCRRRPRPSAGASLMPSPTDATRRPAASPSPPRPASLRGRHLAVGQHLRRRPRRSPPGARSRAQCALSPVIIATFSPSRGAPSPPPPRSAWQVATARMAAGRPSIARRRRRLALVGEADRGVGKRPAPAPAGASGGRRRPRRAPRPPVRARRSQAPAEALGGGDLQPSARATWRRWPRRSDARRHARPPPPVRTRRRARKPSATTRSVSCGLPTVSVPVLSTATTAASRSSCSASPLRNSTPICAARPVDHDRGRRRQPIAHGRRRSAPATAFTSAKLSTGTSAGSQTAPNSSQTRRQRRPPSPPARTMVTLSPGPGSAVGALRRLDHADDLREHGVRPPGWRGRRGTAGVERAADHGRAGAFSTGTGSPVIIDSSLKRTLDHLAIDHHLLARAHLPHVAHCDLGDRRLHHPGVAPPAPRCAAGCASGGGSRRWCGRARASSRRPIGIR